MDLIGYDNGWFISDPNGFGNLEVMKDPVQRHKQLSNQVSQLRRYRLDLKAGSADEVKFDHISITDGKIEYNMEMPRFNEREHQGRPYCFAYGMSWAQPRTPT